jgi:hypothetical protein
MLDHDSQTRALLAGIPVADVAFFLSMIVTAIVLAAALAHALELPNKIAMERDNYFVTQQAYRGWSLLSVLLLAQLASLIWLLSLYGGHDAVQWPVGIAIACLVAAQVAFWTFTYPANVATRNWTWIPDNWQTLRRNWEYSHAVGAGFQLIGMGALIVAALARR